MSDEENRPPPPPPRPIVVMPDAYEAIAAISEERDGGGR